jgi:hypothetical protein
MAAGKEGVRHRHLFRHGKVRDLLVRPPLLFQLVLDDIHDVLQADGVREVLLLPPLSSHRQLVRIVLPPVVERHNLKQVPRPPEFGGRFKVAVRRQQIESIPAVAVADEPGFFRSRFVVALLAEAAVIFRGMDLDRFCARSGFVDQGAPAPSRDRPDLGARERVYLFDGPVRHDSIVYPGLH